MMIDKIFMVMAYVGMVIVGLLMMPYLLYLAWVRIIALNKRGERSKLCILTRV